MVEVEWIVNRKKNVYRVGHKGKVSDFAMALGHFIMKTAFVNGPTIC